MRISDWSSDVCSSVLVRRPASYVFAGQADAALAPTHDSGNGFHGCAFTGAIATQQCQCFAFMQGKGKTEQNLAGIIKGVNAIYLEHGRRGCAGRRSEEHTSEPQSLMRISYAVFCLKKKKQVNKTKETRK